jgi:cysteinyl-tRNA synthetase
VVTFCSGDDENENGNETGNTIFKQHMRSFVMDISQYAKSVSENFIVIPQNGPELVTLDGTEEGEPVLEYLNAIDGAGREDLFYGYNADNRATPGSEAEYMLAFLDICEQYGVEVLTTDYCRDHGKMDDSYTKNAARGYISFAAPDRELNIIPDYPATPYGVNGNDIHTLADARNFLYIINTGDFSSSGHFVDALKGTNYDLFVIDLFFEDLMLTPGQVSDLKLKKNGGRRLVLAYMSIGEAEDYRYYWESSWTTGNPAWLTEENPDWEGNYKVKYWEPAWQQIILGNDQAYLDRIIEAGFDGVYLDIIDAFEYFE